MAKQLEFKLKKPNLEFGGSLLKQGHNPRTKRPLESKLPIHLVLKANQGGMRTPKTFNKINGILEQAAKKHGVRIYRAVNVGNHIHIALKLTRIHRWTGFIREITGRIASSTRNGPGNTGHTHASLRDGRSSSKPSKTTSASTGLRP